MHCQNSQHRRRDCQEVVQIVTVQNQLSREVFWLRICEGTEQILEMTKNL